MDSVFVQRDLIYRSINGENLLLDAYLPLNKLDNSPLPGVIFIHGGPIPPEWAMKETGQYLSWGALAADDLLQA
jgi:hypothetical protein